MNGRLRIFTNFYRNNRIVLSVLLLAFLQSFLSAERASLRYPLHHLAPVSSTVPPHSLPETGSAQENSVKTIRILIIDDQPGVARSVEMALEDTQEMEPEARNYEFATEIAGSVEQAKTMILDQRPDIIITDLELPDGSAVDIARFVREENPEQRIILMTAQSDPQKVASAREEVRPHAFMKKPFRLEEPGDRVMELIRDKRDSLPDDSRDARNSTKLEVTAFHHGILNRVEEGDTILLFDYDPDNWSTNREKTFLPRENNWIIFAKRKGARIWWIRPRWSTSQLGEQVDLSDFEGVLNEKQLDQLPRLQGRVIVTFCMDFFANRPFPWGEVSMQRRKETIPTKRQIQRQVKHIAGVLKEKTNALKMLHLAQSVKYAYQEQLEFVQTQLEQSLGALFHAWTGDGITPAAETVSGKTAVAAAA